MERLSLLYASALFDLAISKNSIDEFYKQAALMRDTLSDAECQRVLVHPHIPAADKREFFKKAFAGQVHEDLLGLLYLSADKNREKYLIPALDGLMELIKRHKGLVTAEVSTAVPLDDKQKESLRNILSRKINKSVELSVSVNPSLIGGPHIFVDGYYIDWTIKSKLRDLTVHMKEGCSA